MIRPLHRRVARWARGRVTREALPEPEDLSRYHLGPIQRPVRKACHIQAALSATEHLDGSIVECGVATASTLSIFVHALRRMGRSDAVFAVDSYEGFPSLSEHDGDWFDPQTMKLHYRGFDVEFAQANLVRTGLTDDEVASVTFVKGWIPDALTHVHGPIRVLHLDVDLYRSYADALRTLWPQVVPGGWILFDEYDQGRDLQKWPGAKRAIDEFASEVEIELHRHWSGFVHAIRPDIPQQ